MSKIWRFLLVAIGIVLLVTLLWYARTIISYVLISAVLALMGRPVMKLLERVHIAKRPLGASLRAILTVFLFLVVLLGLFSLFIPLVVQEARLIAGIDVEQVSQNLQQPLQEFEAFMAQYDLALSQDQAPEDYVKSKVAGLIDLTKVSNIFGSMIGVLGNVFIALFSIIFITFFFLKDSNMFRNIVLSLTPDPYVDQVSNIMENAKKTLSRYFLGILTQVTVITVLVTIGLSLLGVKNAILIGFFAGMVNVIPYVGPLIGMAFGVIIAMTTSLHLDFYNEMIPLASYIVMLFLAIQLLDNFILQPVIFSNSVNVHPLEIFLVILVAGTITGVGGMILAVPAYSFIRIVAKEFFSQFKVVQSLTRNME